MCSRNTFATVRRCAYDGTYIPIIILYLIWTSKVVTYLGFVAYAWVFIGCVFGIK